MKKFTLVMVLMLVVAMMTGAMAETVTSPTDKAQVVGTTPSNGTGTGTDDKLIFITEETDWTKEVLSVMGDRVLNMPIIRFFNEEVQQEVQGMMPEYDIDELVAYEIWPVASEGYLEEMGNVFASFVFATPYVEDQEIAVILGQVRDANGRELPLEPEKMTEEELKAWIDPMDWIVLPTYVDENGYVVVDFSEFVLNHMETDTALMVVVSSPLV